MQKDINTLDVFVLTKSLDEKVIFKCTKLMSIDKVKVFILYQQSLFAMDRLADLSKSYEGKLDFIQDQVQGIDRLVCGALSLGVARYVTIFGDDDYDTDELGKLIRLIDLNEFSFYYLNSIDSLGKPSVDINGLSTVSPENLIREVQTDLGFISALVFKRAILRGETLPPLLIGTNWAIFYFAIKVLEKIDSAYVYRRPVFQTPQRNLLSTVWYDMPRTHSINFVKVFNCLSESPYKSCLRDVINRKVRLTIRFNIRSRLCGERTGMATKLSFNLKDFILAVRFKSSLTPYLVGLVFLNTVIR